VYHTIAGLPYTTTLDLLPLVYRDVRGNSDAVYRVNRGSTTLEVYESMLPKVNGKQLSVRSWDVPVGYPTPPYTGRVKTPVVGWKVGGEMSITTDTPGPFTLLSVSSEAMSEAL